MLLNISRLGEIACGQVRKERVYNSSIVSSAGLKLSWKLDRVLSVCYLFTRERPASLFNKNINCVVIKRREAARAYRGFASTLYGAVFAQRRSFCFIDEFGTCAKIMRIAMVGVGRDNVEITVIHLAVYLLVWDYSIIF